VAQGFFASETTSAITSVEESQKVKSGFSFDGDIGVEQDCVELNRKPWGADRSVHEKSPSLLRMVKGPGQAAKERN